MEIDNIIIMEKDNFKIILWKSPTSRKNWGIIDSHQHKEKYYGNRKGTLKDVFALLL